MLQSTAALQYQGTSACILGRDLQMYGTFTGVDALNSVLCYTWNRQSNSGQMMGKI